MQWSSHDCHHLVSLFGGRRSRFFGKRNWFEQERSSLACANECSSEHLPVTIVSEADECSKTEAFRGDKAWFCKTVNIVWSSREPTDFRVSNNSLFARLQVELRSVKAWNLSFLNSTTRSLRFYANQAWMTLFPQREIIRSLSILSTTEECMLVILIGSFNHMCKLFWNCYCVKKNKTLITFHNNDVICDEIKMRQRKHIEKCLKLLAKSYGVLKPIIATFEKKI